MADDLHADENCHGTPGPPRLQAAASSCCVRLHDSAGRKLPESSSQSSVLTDLPLPPHATNQRPQLDGPRLVAVLRRGGRATTLHIGATVVHLSALTAELTPNRRTPTSLPVIHLPGVRGRSGVAHHTRRTDLDADNMASSALQPECSLPPCGPDF